MHKSFSAGAAILLAASARAQTTPTRPESTDVQRLRAAIETRYIGARPTTIDTAQSVDELLRLLDDPSTRRLTSRQFAAFVRETSGAPHVGVGLAELLGVDYDRSGKRITIITTEPDSPARQARLRGGDIIEAVGGMAVAGRPLADVSDMLRGREGSAVTLSIRRGARRLRVTLRRAAIPAHGAMVRYSMAASRTSNALDESVGCLRIGGFTAATADSVGAALRSLGPHATRLIVDLRGNPGGDLGAARRVAGYFVGGAPIGLSFGRGGVDTIRATGTLAVRLPLTVWVDDETASAAELLTSGLRDAAGATVEGERTVGKGLVHSLFGPLRDGSYVIYTVARLASLDGRELLGNGVTPSRRVQDSRSCSAP